MCVPQSQEAVGPGLIHCKKYRVIGSLEDLDGVPWRDVLVGASPRDGDELAGLRSRMEALPGVAGGDGGATGSKGEKEDAKKKDKTKKKKKKHQRSRKRSGSRDSKKRKRSRSSRSRRSGGGKEKKSAGDIGVRSPARSSSSSSTHELIHRVHSGRPEEDVRPQWIGPMKKARNHQRRKAQRYAQRSRSKKGDSKSSSSGRTVGLPCPKKLGLRGWWIFVNRVANTTWRTSHLS